MIHSIRFFRRSFLYMCILGTFGLVSCKGLKGDKGEIGLKGDKGETGLKGDKGETGLKGDKGETGPKGDKGETGPKGDKGETGLKGDKGETPQRPELGDLRVLLRREMESEFIALHKSSYSMLDSKYRKLERSINNRYSESIARLYAAIQDLTQTKAADRPRYSNDDGYASPSDDGYASPANSFASAKSSFDGEKITDLTESCKSPD